jgi:hypothetical protein
VPANFANEARLATMEAGAAAGLEVTHLINEPTAALFFYSFDRPITGTVVVYDFGGGTLDVTLARVDGKHVEIVTSRGDPRLGGIDFDRKLEDVVRAAYRAEAGELFDPAVHRCRRRSRNSRSSSARDEATISVAGGAGGRRSFRVTRAEFEKACATLISKSALLVESVLTEARPAPAAVSDVFLVGGSTRMPMVQHLERQLAAPVCHVNPDEVAALGAALYAGWAAVQGDGCRSSTRSSTGGRLAEPDRGREPLFRDDLADGGERAPAAAAQHDRAREEHALAVLRTESYYTVAYGQRRVDCQVTQASTRETDPDFGRIWSGSLGPLPRPPSRDADAGHLQPTEARSCTARSST